MRVGIGVDVHRFDPTRPLVLGGVEISASGGLAGHSDADVLCHAVADALLGAAALGDLGEHFPGDDRWKDASSLAILGETRRLIEKAGYAIGNVDATVVAQRPRLAPYQEAMRARVAQALGIEPGAVGIKATTSDGLGLTGRGEGIAALAVAVVESIG